MEFQTKIYHTFCLSKEEFKELCKTPDIALKFYRLKFEIVSGADFTRLKIDAGNWLLGNCSDLYYIEGASSRIITIYFFAEADAVLFKLQWCS